MSKATDSRTKLSRRAAIAGTLASAVPAVAIPAPADPIFALIDAHARAYADVVALMAAQDKANAALQQADATAQPALEARLEALCKAEWPLAQIERATADRIATTVPATLAGMAAVLRHVRAIYERDEFPLYEEDEYRVLLHTAERAIDVLAG
jgi:hypothetical protein